MKQTIIALIIFLVISAPFAAISDAQEDKKNKEKCMENLRVIGEALKAYRADRNNQMPDWLSDLYPKYLQDPRILLCPADKTGTPADEWRKAFKDPKMPCSYLYEFNPEKFLYGIFSFEANPLKEPTFKEAKTASVKYFGSLVPAARCWHHGVQVINVGYDGRVYITGNNWEYTPEAAKSILSSFRKAMERNPEGWEKEFSVKAMCDYFNYCLRLPDFLSILEKMQNPSLETLEVLSNIYNLDVNTSKEIETLKRLLHINPKDTDARLRLAKLYAMTKKYDLAREQCQQIIQLKPEDSGASSLLIEMDAIADGQRIQKRFSKTRAEEQEMHYLMKLEEMLLASKGDQRAKVREMLDIAQDSFGESPSVTRLTDKYRKLCKSFGDPRGQWRIYNSSDGLPSNWVYSFAQDDRGILWIGTWGGVCQYNGENFLPFKTGKEIDKDFIYSILIDNQRHIWFGTWGNGVFLYDGQNLFNYKSEDGLAGNSIRRIFQSSDGAVWLCYWDKGLTRYDGKSFRNFTASDGLAGDYVYTIAEDGQGNLWIGTDNGVSKYDGKGFTNLTEANGLPGNYVYMIVKGQKGELWFATDKGFCRYDGKNFTTVKEGAFYVTDGLRDRKGNIWFTTHNGLFCYDGEAFINLTDRDGLATNWITTIFEDREGNIWIGYDYVEGMGKLNPDLRNYGVEDGLAGVFIYTIAEDSKGDMWVSTNRGICKYDGREFTQPIPDSRRVLGPVYKILADSKGNLWFATTEDHWSSENVPRQPRGIIRFDGRNYRRFTTLDGLSSNNVFWVMEDSRGDIWMGHSLSVGSWFSTGLSRYDGEKFTNFTVADGLVNNNATCLAEDLQGNIWMGSWSGGISRYDGTSFTNFTGEDGLEDTNVFKIFADRQGRVWIGTGSGLSVYDGRSFTKLPQFSGRFIADITMDRSGYLWIASDGTSRTDGKVFSLITKSDGLPSNSVQTVFEDKRGDIWIGTKEGLTRYTPNHVPPLLHIESIKADRDYKATENISLPARTGRFTINYRAISFRTRPEAMQYFYQLEGHDDDWQGPVKSRSADYSGLKSGNYTFKVKAVDMDLNYSEPVSISIKILPPPLYQTGIFLIGLSIIGGASLFLAGFLMVQRSRSSRAEKLRLQQELEDAHRMQTRLLPQTDPVVEGFHISGVCKPAREVGGDFFDYLMLGNGKVGVALADASGKGLRGAMNAVLANGMLHEVAKDGKSCGGILTVLNADLYPRIDRMMFTAMGLGILDKYTGTLQWSSAAQPYPIVKRGDQILEFKGDGQLPLGMMPTVSYSDEEIGLQPGDIVIFYTDGIIEAENEAEEMYGTERLEQVIASMDSAMNVEEIIESILRDVAGFAGDAEQYDDMTVLVVKKV